MIQINYPAFKPLIKKSNQQELIFCAVRKKWIVLTPEEWVRQNFILYLHETLGYALSLMAVEKKIAGNEVHKRFDIVVYTNEMKPHFLVECKEMNVELNETTLKQALNYFSTIQSNCLVITNGNQTYAFEKKGNELIELSELK
jgi:hypothetical protein